VAAGDAFHVPVYVDQYVVSSCANWFCMHHCLFLRCNACLFTPVMPAQEAKRGGCRTAHVTSGSSPLLSDSSCDGRSELSSCDGSFLFSLHDDGRLLGSGWLGLLPGSEAHVLPLHIRWSAYPFVGLGLFIGDVLVPLQ
jgi:hypothetical protein